MQATTASHSESPRQSRGKQPPKLSRSLPLVGHMVEFSRNPFELLMRARKECGEVAQFKLLKQDFVLLTGPRANEAFFRAPDDQLCRREAYKVMTPIFGKGVVFDAPPDRMKQQIRMMMPLVHDQRLKTYPPVIAQETRDLLSRWGDAGELDLLSFTKELTLRTSTHCLIGSAFRAGLNEELTDAYRHLELGVNALAYLYPDLPLPSFKRRDQAREKLGKVVSDMVDERRGRSDAPDDGLQVLLDSTYEDGSKPSPHEITGILTALMLAGHHTSAGTAAWIIIELARNPAARNAVLQELNETYADGGEVTFESLRKLRYLNNVVKEVLRLHPPLIFLFRKVLRDFHYRGYTVPKGGYVTVSPAVSHRIAEAFPHPNSFDPDRYLPERAEDKLFAWIGFGGGRNKCTGSAFGILQLKAIMATVLRAYDFDLVKPAHQYVDDYTKPTILPKGPCTIAYRRRTAPVATPTRQRVEEQDLELDKSKSATVTIDWDLCQGHAACMGEAPEVFEVGASGELVVLQEQPDAALYESIARAARYCPNSAISIQQE
jgi:sterol 14-demethylase